jgi:hypothetical protein
MDVLCEGLRSVSLVSGPEPADRTVLGVAFGTRHDNKYRKYSRLVIPIVMYEE